MGAKIMATLTALVGGSAILFSLATAFGLNFNIDQRSAIEGGLGLVVLIAGLWLHPSVPVGTTQEKPPEGEENVTSVNPLGDAPDELPRTEFGGN